MRKRCEKKGHNFDGIPGGMFVFCRRWGCKASAVSIWAPPALAVVLHNAIPWEHRYPQVEYNEDGSVKDG